MTVNDMHYANVGSYEPLSYTLRENIEVLTPWELTQPEIILIRSGSLQEELVARLPHSGPIYYKDNKTVYLKKEAVRGTSVKSTIKSFQKSCLPCLTIDLCRRYQISIYE